MNARAAFEKVNQLYGATGRQHRYYVSTKLKTDPLATELYELAQSEKALGRVIDAGAGRGQFGYLLLVLGAASSIRGFDLDEAKVEVALQAAAAWNEKGTRRVEQYTGDLLTADYSGSDTILLLDVLHYLPREEQFIVVKRASDALPQGGRLVVRETGRGSGVGAAAAQVFEQIGRLIGVNGGRAMEFLTPEELEGEMVRIGLDVERRAPRGALSNVLLVGTKRSA